jgi:HEPN domain-containing protein
MAELDIQKQLAYWRDGAVEAFGAAQDMILRDQRVLFGLFFVHLTLEKALKAYICRQTGQLPPRIHNLIRLAEIAGLNLDEEQIKIMAAVNEFNLEGRYPETWMPPPTLDEAKEYLMRSKKVFEWLNNLLSKP